MNITSLASVQNAIGAPGLPGAIGGTAQAGSPGSFGSTIRNAMDSIDQQQVAADQEVAKTVAGESPDLHRTMATLQMADLSFQLGLQIRNKMIDAYQQVMQMQV